MIDIDVDHGGGGSFGAETSRGNTQVEFVYVFFVIFTFLVIQFSVKS